MIWAESRGRYSTLMVARTHTVLESRDRALMVELFYKEKFLDIPSSWLPVGNL